MANTTTLHLYILSRYFRGGKSAHPTDDSLSACAVRLRHQYYRAGQPAKYSTRAASHHHARVLRMKPTKTLMQARCYITWFDLERRVRA